MTRADVWEKLDGAGAAASVVGGKAAALDRLVAAGTPVPLAAALTVEAYASFVEASGLAAFLAALPASVEPAVLGEDAERVERAFLEAPLPPPLRHAIHDAYEYVSGGGPVAVRSSATAEDLAGASFAGQYRSFLGVGLGDLERAVRLCWASLWAPGARAYRHAQGLNDADVAMGVVVQRMVLAERSGVVFTVDPTAPGSESLRVEVVEGLGERLVSGEVTPDVFHLRRDDLSVLDEGAPSFLPALARRALEIEAALGAPQDIEWSVASGAVHILQARPITTEFGLSGDGFDTPPVPGVTFTSAGVGEMLPGVLSPLLWSTNAPLLEDAFKNLYASLGIQPRGPTQPMLGRFRGRAALNLSFLKAAARRMPGGSGAEVERQYLGRVFSDEREPPTRLRHRLGRIRPAWRALRLRKRLVRDADVVCEAARLALEVEPDHQRLRTDALVAYRHRVRDLARFGVQIEVAVAASAAANYRGLEIALERWLGKEEASLAAQRLTAGTVREQAGGCAAVLSLWDVHCDYCQLPEVARAVYEGPVEETEQRLRDLGERGQGFLRIVYQGLRRSGSAALYGGPTWEEQRDSLWSVLRQCRTLRPEEGPTRWMDDAAARGAQYLADLERRIRRTWKWRLTRVLTGQIVDIRRRLLRRMVEDAATFLRLREAVKSTVLQIGGEERRVVRELARRLVERGALEHDGDEFLLSSEELDRLALGHSGPDRLAIQRRRAALDAARDASPLPELFSGFPSAEAETDIEMVDGVLSGWATSPGRVTGTARVVRDLADAHDLVRGEILVGHSTDPSWTPLFLTAAAIVMEEGGPLSHAAIVAREFNLPAVLNVKGATRTISTGTLITVDGSRGTVEVAAQEEAGSAG
ncbi:MAG: PEP/pyruvate-binding domain-containing protein [Actinomycetota bacterium]